MRKICAENPRLGLRLPKQCKSHITGAATQVKNLRVRTIQYPGEALGGASPPQAINIERQYVVEQVVTRSYGREHLADSDSCRMRIRRAFRAGTKNTFVGVAQRDCARNFWMDLIMAALGTSFTTSTSPIARGRTKCTTPLVVFLSDPSKRMIRSADEPNFGRLPS